MATSPLLIGGFGGLNLVDDIEQVGLSSAVDLKNVWFPNGRVESMPSPIAFATATRAVKRIAVAGSEIVASESDGTNTTLQAFNSGGTATGSTTYAVANTDPHAFATVGTPTTTRTYAIRLGDTTRRWDTASWTTVAAVPPAWCAATTSDFRLAVGNVAASAHRVQFSDPGDPETFGVNNFVDLTPGDGEVICAMVTWQNKLFVFKNTKFFVFTTPGVDADGEPLFSYYGVEGGLGITYTGNRGAGACAGPDGVYFCAPSGVYRTAGGTPQLVSGAISPLFPTELPVTYTSVPSLNPASFPCDLSWAAGALYLSTSNISSNLKVTMVYKNGQWSYWDLQANSTSNAYANVIEYRGGTYYVIANSSSIQALSNRGNLTWSWTSGLADLSNEGRVAVTLETALWGTGAATLQIANDHGSFDTGSAVTLGVDPAVVQGWQQIDREGVFWQQKLSGTTAASINRLAHFVSFIKPAGIG